MWGWKFLLLIIFLGSHSAQALCVNTYMANLRKGPGTSFQKTWQVGKYTPLLKIGRKGNWLKVKDQEGVVHWIFGSQITYKVRCMAVKVSRAGIRKGPGTNHAYAELQYVDRYTPLKRLDLDGDWFHVESNSGQRFWIHRKNVWRPLKVSTINY